MTYTPRKTAPENGDPYWTKTTNGGYNEQILGNQVNRPWDGSVLPNCTGYVHGRFMEIGNQHYDYDPSILPWSDAASYFVNSSLEKGQDPQLGACMVWGVGHGHVAIVEEIIDSDTVITSESDYGDEKHGGTVFVTRTRRRGWNWGYYSGYSRAFLGFLYHPGISPEPPSPAHKLEVTGGIPAEKYGTEGETVEITVDKTKIPKYYSFMRWDLTGGGEIITDVSRETITYKFGDKDGSVKALYKYTPPSMNISLYIGPPIYRKY